MKNLLILLVLAMISIPCRSDVKLPAIFSDNMVLQRDMPITLWGWADKNEKIALSLGDQTMTTRAGKDGTWSIELQAISAGPDPLTLNIQGKNQISLENILMGDVWICSGQSNMFWPLNRLDTGKAESETANYPELRMFTVELEMALDPQDDLNGSGWIIAEGEHILDFSSVAYYFGKYLQKETGIPVGLISTSWGGTNVEAWASMETLKRYPHIDSVYKGLDKSVDYSNTGSSKAREQRADALNEIAAADIGVLEEWYKHDMSFVSWDWITLPQDKTNQFFRTFDGAIWFRKSFDLPSPFRDMDIQFNLGQFKDHGMVWLNGHKLGETYEPKWQRYRADAKCLKLQGNEILIRVFNGSGDGGVIGNPMQMNYHPVDDPEGKQLLCGEWQFKVSQELQAPMEIPMGLTGRSNVNSAPSSLYNQMIHPLLNLSITGAIWYQGESNASRAHEYASLFPDMIMDWRKHWDQGDFPFLFVQLAAYDRPKTPIWPELREAQRKALELPYTGMAVTTDIGHPTDIHPQNKWDVGKRLALPALKMVYGKDITYSGPELESVNVRDGKIVISFTQVGEGLSVMGKYGYLMGFELSENNEEFRHAKARIIDPSTVEVWSEQMPDAKYVRYAWKNYPENASLFNSEKLPASPFRTGAWTWITEGNTY